jgi:hypothetical protein
MKKKKNTGPSTTTTDAPETGTLESDIASPREASESTEPIGLRIDAGHERAAGKDDATAAAGAEHVAPTPNDDLAGVPVADLSEELAAAVLGQTLASREEQMQEQAADLAAHLQARLREIEKREAHLNARLAQFDSDVRAARLWQREQQFEFDQREAELRRQLAELQARAAAVATSEQSLETLADYEQQMLQREKSLQEIEQQLREQRQTLDRELQTLQDERQAWEQFRGEQEQQLDLQRRSLLAEIEQYKAQLEQPSPAPQISEAQRVDQQRAYEETLRKDYDELAAQLLADARERQSRLDALREELDRERATLQEETALLAEQRQAFHEHQQAEREALHRRLLAAENEIQQHHTQLAERDASLDRERESLEQVRTEITAAQRQTLEMRIITEQLWAQVTGRLSSPEITHSIAHLRLQLAEHYRLEQESLKEQKETLLQLAERVKQQHQTVARQRDEIKLWAANQQAEIERQAKRLVARELELDEQQQRFETSAADWSAERRQYEQRIRTLTAQLSRVPAAA